MSARTDVALGGTVSREQPMQPLPDDRWQAVGEEQNNGDKTLGHVKKPRAASEAPVPPDPTSQCNHYADENCRCQAISAGRRRLC